MTSLRAPLVSAFLLLFFYCVDGVSALPEPDIPNTILENSEHLKILDELRNPTPLYPQKKKRKRTALRHLRSFSDSKVKIAATKDSTMIFDLPVTYNKRVRKWVRYFQTSGRKWFKRWLERSHRFIPSIQKILTEKKLPLDLAYLSMIESGFSSRAVSSAAAVGPWQFIRPTGEQYGLRMSWWLDERRDFTKSTYAAAHYLKYLHGLFNSWHLAAAAYNMGENRLRRLIKKYNTKDYWELSMKPSFARETKDYVPKLMAAILMAKAPALYGFRNLYPQKPFDYQKVPVPGGTDLINLANYLNVTHRYIKDLNPELIQGFVPKYIASHEIRVPSGAAREVSRYVAKTGLGKRVSKK